MTDPTLVVNSTCAATTQVLMACPMQSWVTKKHPNQGVQHLTLYTQNTVYMCILYV